VSKTPISGFLVIGLGIDSDGISLNFAKAIEIELSDKGRKIIVLEELRDNDARKVIRVFYKERDPIVRPANK
jgi:hypothetical protein